MPVETSRPVLLQTEVGASQASLGVRQYAKSERLSRAAIALVACWVVAGISVFIPIAHFVLVPGFFIAGPVLAVMRFNLAEAKLGVDGQCPHCSKNAKYTMEADDKLPKSTYCPLCDKPVQIIDK